MSKRLGGTSVIASIPSVKSFQKASGPLAPGKRQPIPTIAISSARMCPLWLLSIDRIDREITGFPAAETLCKLRYFIKAVDTLVDHRHPIVLFAIGHGRGRLRIARVMRMDELRAVNTFEGAKIVDVHSLFPSGRSENSFPAQRLASGAKDRPAQRSE